MVIRRQGRIVEVWQTTSAGPQLGNWHHVDATRCKCRIDESCFEACQSYDKNCVFDRVPAGSRGASRPVGCQYERRLFCLPMISLAHCNLWNMKPPIGNRRGFKSLHFPTHETKAPQQKICPASGLTPRKISLSDPKCSWRQELREPSHWVHVRP